MFAGIGCAEDSAGEKIFWVSSEADRTPCGSHRCGALPRRRVAAFCASVFRDNAAHACRFSYLLLMRLRVLTPGLESRSDGGSGTDHAC